MASPSLYDRWIVAGLVLLAMTGSSEGQVAQRGTLLIPVDLEGTVYDRDGQPAPGAAVWAYPCTQNAYRMVETCTNADGRFKLGLTQGEWRVVARKESRSGVANNAYGVVGIVPSNPPDPCVIRLTPVGKLRGRLLDRQSGEPIPNGRIWIDDCGLVQADEKGRYEVPALNSAPHHLVTLCLGYGRAYLLCDTTLRVEAELDLQLPRGIQITGTVVDQHGQPIPGACVGPPTSGRKTALVALYEPCDENGRFVWDGLAREQPYVFEASAPGYASEQKDILVTEGVEPSELFFVLKPDPLGTDRVPGRTIAGIVTEPDGRPARDAQVRWHEGHSQQRRRETQTDRQGRFKLHNVPDVIGYLEVICAGHEPIYEAVLRQGNLDGHINLGSGKAVRGRVQDANGKPVEGVMVVPVVAASLQRGCSEPWVWQLHTLTDKDGRFELNHLPRSGFRYDFHSQGGSFRSLMDLKDAMTVTLPGTGAICGRVVDPAGQPVRGFRISLDHSSCEPTRPTYQPAQVTMSSQSGGSSGGSHTHVTGFYAGLHVTSLGVLYTSEDGTFVLSGLHTDGIEIVVADAPGHGQVFVDCVHTQPVEKLPPADDLVLQLQQSHRLRVRVVKEADPETPVAGAKVALVPCSIDDLIENRMTPPYFCWGRHDCARRYELTDENGWASFADVPFEGAMVIVRAAGRARTRMGWRAGQAEMIVPLKPECAVSGVVTKSGSQEPIRECFVHLERGSHEETFGWRVGPADQGQFRFTELPPGDYVLQVARNEIERQHRIFYQTKFTLGQGQSYIFSTIGRQARVQYLEPGMRAVRTKTRRSSY